MARRTEALARSLVLCGMSAAIAAPATGQDGAVRGRRGMRPDRAPQVGQAAPTFNLEMLDGESKVALESFRGEKPVVLIFGSYT